MTSVSSVGETAGKIWSYLEKHGRSSISAIEKGTKAPKREVHMALGWLAREDKIELGEENRAVNVWLKGG
jgi:Winged helix-turn-helix domain (DUF2582)